MRTHDPRGWTSTRTWIPLICRLSTENFKSMTRTRCFCCSIRLLNSSVRRSCRCGRGQSLVSGAAPRCRPTPPGDLKSFSQKAGPVLCASDLRVYWVAMTLRDARVGPAEAGAQLHDRSPVHLRLGLAHPEAVLNRVRMEPDGRRRPVQPL